MDRKLWRRHVEYLDKFSKRASHADEAERLGISSRLQLARKILLVVESPDFLNGLAGTLGVEPIGGYL